MCIFMTGHGVRYTALLQYVMSPKFRCCERDSYCVIGEKPSRKHFGREKLSGTKLHIRHSDIFV